jgi:hypothetical protein
MDGLDVYKRAPSFVLGFHGCDREVGEAVLRGECNLTPSKNQYDWLGDGIYFWEANPARAFEFAHRASLDAAKTTQGKIKTPFVVGAVIDLGVCFSLQDSSCLSELPVAYDALKKTCEVAGIELPKNVGRDGDKVVRNLDCAVIAMMHSLRQNANPPLPPYDSVRCAFSEGAPAFPGGFFCEKSHVQIAVRNPDQCVLGYFRPRNFNPGA